MGKQPRKTINETIAENPVTEFVIPSEYARIRGVSYQRIFELIKLGRFETKQIGRRTYIRDWPKGATPKPARGQKRKVDK